MARSWIMEVSGASTAAPPLIPEPLPGRCPFTASFAGARPVPHPPAEHQSRRQKVEPVQEPDRARRQVEDVDRVDRVTDVGEDEVADAVRGEVSGPGGLHQHR
jgi:hypothetical protein